ncbi:nucleoside deaminase [Kitasatospora sp. NA04385]|uniref:nucleoside deaminase n=1 Tax=Kitasatospora sp. NA04385 TaxID=2742135 RepID=UPI0015917BD9|nr:nucleoside deaminase [Kitasatospora sp. NA04385]QKW20453.1 nucleoside deaminase [Kitasatospora sp. NA04385]
MQPVPLPPDTRGERPRIAPLPAPERPDPVRDRWRDRMRLAIEEAALATATGDVPVGAFVLGPDGTVLGRGHNVREAVGDPTGHAEVVAIRRAARALNGAARSASDEDGGRRGGEWRLSGCTLVVTLEPCTMCAGAIVLSRLARVIFGAYDPKAGAAGSLFDVVRDNRLNHRPEVVGGVLAEECTAQLLAFFDTQR